MNKTNAAKLAGFALGAFLLAGGIFLKNEYDANNAKIEDQNRKIIEEVARDEMGTKRICLSNISGRLEINKDCMRYEALASVINALLSEKSNCGRPGGNTITLLDKAMGTKASQPAPPVP